MRIKLREAIVGDRFVDAATGVAWTVLMNNDGWVKLVSDHRQPFEGLPPAEMEIEVTNRDPNLTDAGALANLMNAGAVGQVLGVEGPG